VAHGTAMDIAAKGIADPAALIAAIEHLTGHPI
jgi:4-hydroxy-L-threonine phosphate dehydrogenase PdxA